jgi:hypothetical protein
MTPAQAQEIIKGLAGGLDASTGEVLPEGGPLSHPHVIRALFMAAQALEQAAAKAARPVPGNAGKPWSEEEDQRLMAAFDGGTSVAELARAHERSRGAITSRLMRFGRLQVGREGEGEGGRGHAPDRQRAMAGH